MQGLQVRTCTLESLQVYATLLKAGAAFPVGDVPFMQEAFRLAGAQQPRPECYPAALTAFLHREVWCGPLQSLTTQSPETSVFVKPVALKQFTGFVYPGTGSAHDQAQRKCVQHWLSTPQAAALLAWFSTPVNFLSEYRYYIHKNQIMGVARYDPEGADDAPEPCVTQVEAALVAWAHQAPVSYALDVGVLASGETALVEVNDGWALGLYAGALSPEQYLQFLYARWLELLSTAPPVA